MLDIFVVKRALKRCQEQDPKRGRPVNSDYEQTSIISFVIHDLFGGEILKARSKRGWYFYNRIEGERFDFTGAGCSKSSVDNYSEDLPSSPEEIINYFAHEDYITFFAKFISAFEEAVGLKEYRRDRHYNMKVFN